jgi:hypothetical protein
MPEICTGSDSPNNCGHRILTIGALTFHTEPSEIIGVLTDEEKIATLKNLIKWRGLDIFNLVNRIISGDEATNVKIYTLFGPGVAITKTNIGINYINICPGFNGERTAVDFTGCTEYRLMLHANLVGSGQFGARIVKDDDNTILHETANLGASGERELDSNWQPLPVAFRMLGLTYLRAQAKSTTASDDPVFRSLKLGLR